MSQYFARKKALNQKRDEMMDLFVDSKIKLANKGTSYGEFYDYVTDLDRQAPKAKRAKPAVIQPKPSIPATPVQSKQPVVQKLTVSAPQTQATQAAENKVERTVEVEEKGNSSFWENYTE